MKSEFKTLIVIFVNIRLKAKKKTPQKKISCNCKQTGDNIVGGTGVGLALIKWMLEVYEGQNWLISKVGKDSTFYFTIPEMIEEDYQDCPINIAVR